VTDISCEWIAFPVSDAHLLRAINISRRPLAAALRPTTQRSAAATSLRSPALPVAPGSRARAGIPGARAGAGILSRARPGPGSRAGAGILSRASPGRAGIRGGAARPQKHQFGVVFPCPNHCWAHGGARGPKILPRADLCKTSAPVRSELNSGGFV